MPYIPKNRRPYFTDELDVCIDGIEKKGDLTFCVYYLALKMAQSRVMNYTNISSAISCLKDAADELRRRHLDPYEDGAIEKNGDIK